MLFTYLTREAWGADPSHPRLGLPPVPHSLRIYDLTHHTVGVDNDQTRNVWETLEEVKANARVIQVVRPDLGYDVPYNWLAYLMENHTLTICEGRGFENWGAHTADKDSQGRWWNGAGVATAYAGNFEDFPTDITPWLPAINEWNAAKKSVLPNLEPPFLGHRDTGAQTACPGRYLHSMLNQFHFYPPAEEDDMTYIQWADWKDRPPSAPYRSYKLFVGKDGLTKALVSNEEEHNGLRGAGESLRHMALADLKAYKGGPEPDAS